MKKRLLLAGFCLITGLFTSHAQNKTMGVGTATPNPNAVLHIESPTTNQGFIMPRLTTSQRLAMNALLTVSDNGLMLYDTSLSTVYIWDGTKWKTTTEVAGGSKLAYPYKDSVLIATGTNDLFALKYNNAEPKRVMRLENQNVSNGSSTLSVLNIGTGLAGYFQVNNATGGGSAVYGTTNSNLGGAMSPVGVYGESSGTGSSGGAFRNTNASNTYSALYANTAGTGSSIFAETANGNTAILGQNTRSIGNGFAGLFKNTQSGNTFPAIQASTKGAGPGLRVLQDTASMGGGMDVIMQNPASSAIGFSVQQNGTGNAGSFSINNALSNANALVSTTNGNGSAITTTNTGLHGNAANFSQTAINDSSTVYVNSSNGAPALRIRKSSGDGLTVKHYNPAGAGNAILGETNSNIFGIGVLGYHKGTKGFAGSFETLNAANNDFALKGFTIGGGSAGFFQINNSSNASSAIVGTTNGTGSAGNFQILNAANNNTALSASTNGTGAAISADNTSTGDAVYVVKSGTGGSAGNFQVSNASNPNSALFALTNAPTGTALGLIHNTGGDALAIFTGGIKVSTNTLSVGTNITTRAAAYLITGGGPYTFDVAITLSEGEIFYFYNSTAGIVTVASVTIPAGTGRTYIYLGGILRGF